ncbi:vanadium-dependent haloperoxidase [Streptomyces sp. NPDC003011]
METRPPSRSLRRPLAVGLAALTLGALPWAVPTTAAQEQPPARAAGPQVITDWNKTAVAVVSGDAERPTAEPFVWYGFVSAAVYNAVVGIEGRYTPYRWDVRGPRTASPEAAAAAAARRVLLTYFPGSKSRINKTYTASLAKIPDGKAEKQGVRFGERAADRIIELREDDGRGDPMTYDQKPAAGVWRPALPAHQPFVNPWIARLRPMLLDSPHQFRPGPPPRLTSKRYARDLAEVKAMGAKNSKERTPEQTETALFFGDALPVQFQNSFRGYVARHDLDIVDAARLFAAANTAAADATIATWDCKYTYGQWRPITAIRLADTDDNPATEPDRDWEPLLHTPAYPDWISGHNVNSAAVVTVLDGLTGGDIDLRISSARTGTTRTYTKAADFNQDVIDTRVWAGIHFRTSDIVGNRIGRDIGHFALDRFFQPVR